MEFCSRNLRPQIVELAAKRRMPDFYWASQFVESGGLMSYGENLGSSYRAAAAYIDKIKKGANPANLRVEQPTRFELVINRKTAKVLDLTVPQSLADAGGRRDPIIPAPKAPLRVTPAIQL